MSLAFLFRCFMLNMFQMLIHPSSGACDLFVDLFHGLYCSGTMRVSVTVWCAIRMQAEACIRMAHHTVTPTRIVPEQYNPWNRSTNKSQAPEDGCINIWNMLSMKQRNKKSKWHQVGLSLFNYQDDARSNKHKVYNLFIVNLQYISVDTIIWYIYLTSI